MQVTTRRTSLAHASHHRELPSSRVGMLDTYKGICIDLPEEELQ